MSNALHGRRKLGSLAKRLNVAIVQAEVSPLAKRIGKLLIQAASPKYGCLMAMLPSLESELPNWAAENIDSKTLAEDGIEMETHCTVLYGFDLDFDCHQLIERYSGTGSIKLKLGKLSRFECEKYDVLKFAVESSRIRALNRSINNSFKSSITPSEHEFNPHVTVAYVKKGTNRHLDGSRFEGRELSVARLLYSPPEDEGRCVIELGTKPEEVVAASEPRDFEPGKKAHAAAQDIYGNAAVNAAHSRHESESKLASDVLLALLLAGEESYSKVSQIIAEPLEVDLEPDSLEVQGRDFAESRQPFLENFAKSLAAEIKASRKASKAAGLSDSDTMRALRDVVKKTSRLMTETEATATCGICQQRILQKAGFKTVIWSQLDRPGKRESHELNEQIGEVPIGYTWPNGQQYPGDPEGGPGECVNCECQLIGGSR